LAQSRERVVDRHIVPGLVAGIVVANPIAVYVDVLAVRGQQGQLVVYVDNHRAGIILKVQQHLREVLLSALMVSALRSRLYLPEHNVRNVIHQVLSAEMEGAMATISCPISRMAMVACPPGPLCWTEGCPVDFTEVLVHRRARRVPTPVKQ